MQQQPPANQPYYPPSEIYLYDQPQQFAPAQEITRPPVQRQDIVVYYNRKHAIRCIVIGVAGLVFLIADLAFLCFLIFAIGGPVQARDIGPLAAMLLLFFACMAFVGWFTWRFGFQELRNRKHVLIINSEGITVRKLFSLSGFFISWAEIDVIFTSRYIFYKYFCIKPKNTDAFLSRFNRLERFFRRLNSMIGSPLYIPQIFLDRPVEEILQQLYYMYASELNYYHVQLRS